MRARRLCVRRRRQFFFVSVQVRQSCMYVCRKVKNSQARKTDLPRKKRKTTSASAKKKVRENQVRPAGPDLQYVHATSLPLVSSSSPPRPRALRKACRAGRHATPALLPTLAHFAGDCRCSLRRAGLCPARFQRRRRATNLLFAWRRRRRFCHQAREPHNIRGRHEGRHLGAGLGLPSWPTALAAARGSALRVAGRRV